MAPFASPAGLQVENWFYGVALAADLVIAQRTLFPVPDVMQCSPQKAPRCAGMVTFPGPPQSSDHYLSYSEVHLANSACSQ